MLLREALSLQIIFGIKIKLDITNIYWYHCVSEHMLSFESDSKKKKKKKLPNQSIQDLRVQD